MAKPTGFINIDFAPSLKTVQQDMLRVKAQLDDKAEVMIAAMVVAKREIAENFDEEHDSAGKPWAPWKTTPAKRNTQSYAQRAENYPNIGILQRNGNLRKAAVSDSAFALSGNTLSYGDNLPQWAGVHLHGGKKSYDGYKIPQRSWLPFSAAGVAAVQNIFEAWALGAISIQNRTSVKGRSYTQVQYRTPGGRFGSAV